MHNPFTVCDPLGLSPYSRFKGLGWLTDNQLTRPSFRYQRLVTDQSYEQQWILPDGREVHVNGGLRDGWIASGQLKAYHVPGNGMSGMSSWLK
ncbi:hypothetical protein AB0918_29770 [Streptomyces sp. NPDC006864]|uniref:hypothetical protein n=1 Tax=Streptomyces sp. NPDC006864 TaxID=3154780 RepID=UPI00345138B9